MEILVPMPKEGMLPSPYSWEHAMHIIHAHRPAVESVARRAFVKNERDAWESVQYMLYHWNLEELERKTPAYSWARSIRQALRNIILEIETAARRAQITLECWNDFTPERALEELRQAAMSHRIHTHPLLQELEQRGLSKASIKVFLDNYYVNNRVFHLHIAAQSLSTPFELRGELYKNLHDELGAGDPDAAHPLLFLRNYRSLGGDVQVIKPLLGSIYLLNTKIFHTLLSGNYKQGLGALGFLELAMPNQMQMILDGLKKSGMPERDLIFWDLHISLDKDHGDAWFDEMRRILHTREDAYQMLEGGVSTLEARSVFYDFVWEAIAEGRQHTAWSFENQRQTRDTAA